MLRHIQRESDKPLCLIQKSLYAAVKAGEQRLLERLTGAACATLVVEIAERHAGPAEVT